MIRKSMAWVITAVLSLSVVLPVLAAAPAGGLVVEGERVPGIALGFTRAQVEAAYGEPESCQGPTSSYCGFRTEDGEQVFVRYQGADGGEAAGSPADLVDNIRWYDDDWTTTAGVNTALALADPDAVIAAYPDGQVTTNQWGAIIRVEDARQGIQVDWFHDFYGRFTSVSMAIFTPREPAPPRELLTYVNAIDLSASKSKSQRTIRALVQVRDDRDLAAEGALVTATWQFPDGHTQMVQDTTSGSGYAYFEITGAPRGAYTLTVDEVTLNGYRFDRAGSVLSAGIAVK